MQDHSHGSRAMRRCSRKMPGRSGKSVTGQWTSRHICHRVFRCRLWSGQSSAWPKSPAAWPRTHRFHWMSYVAVPLHHRALLHSWCMQRIPLVALGSVLQGTRFVSIVLRPAVGAQAGSGLRKDGAAPGVCGCRTPFRTVLRACHCCIDSC